MSTDTPGALAGILIIETAERPAGEYTARLLADFGAQVIKVERPGGSRTRTMGPFAQGQSTLFAYLNTNKRTIVLDLAKPEDRAALDHMLASAHALIDDHGDAWTEAHGLAPAAIAAAHPHLVHCLITPFGQGAPREWQNAQPINVMNAGGWAWHSPSEASPDMPPLKGAGRFMPDYDAGLDAALATLASLHRQRHRGAGQFIDISEQQVQINRVDCVLDRMLAGEEEPNHERTRYDMGGPATSFAAKDGYIYLFMTTKAHWLGLCKLMGDPEWARAFPEDWLEFHCTRDRVLDFRAKFAAWSVGQDKHAIAEAGQKLGVAIVPVNSAADLPHNEQFIHRGFFQTLPEAGFGEAPWPTVPYKLSATPVRLTSPPPTLGSFDPPPLGEVAVALATDGGGATPIHTPSPALRAAPPPAGEGFRRHPAKTDRGGPLAGVRVLELTKVWAGPYTGKLLAHLGAEVIKLESRTNLDEMRAYGGVDIDSAPYFLAINQEILSAQVNMKTPEGIDLVRQLVAQSDIVIDNIRPGAMARAGLGYEQLKAIKPDIIQVSIKMWGEDGPLGYQTGYAPCFAALSGLYYLVGYEGETPRGMNIRYGDSTAGACAALAAIAALHHRDATGEGQFIDVSAVEALSSMAGDSLLAYALTGAVPQSDGNAHPEMAPHGAYPCHEAEWISIAVTDDAEWRGLCMVLSAPALATDPRFATLAARLANRHALDEVLGALTRSHGSAELAERLRAAGIAAFRSASSLDLASDGYLWERGGYRMVSDHRHGSRPIIGPSWRMTPDEAAIETGAPLLGEHNDYVYRDILGLSAERLDELIAGKIVD